MRQSSGRLTGREGDGSARGVHTGAPRVDARWRASRAPTPGGADGAVLPAKLRPPQARVRLVERRALLGRARPHGVPARRPLRSRRRRQDHRPPAVGRVRPQAVRLGAAGRGRLRPRRVPHVRRRRRSPRSREVDPSVHDSLSLAVPPVRERVLPLLGEALAAAAAVRARARRRPRASWLQSRGTSSHSCCAACRRERSWRSGRAPTPRCRWRGCAPPARSPRSTPRSSRWMRPRWRSCCACTAARPTRRRRTPSSRRRRAGPPACSSPASPGPAGPPAEWLGEIRGGRREIAEYLTSEVLDAQPADVQEFLLRTSVLLELTPRLCALVWERDDAGELLARVAREELFVVPLGDDGCHYRYHHLFAEMLQDETGEASPGICPTSSTAGWRPGTRRRTCPTRRSTTCWPPATCGRGGRARGRVLARHVEPRPVGDRAPLALVLHRSPDPRPSRR